MLGELRRARVWPRDYDLRLVQERAAEARRRIARLNEQLRRGDVLSSQDQAFRQRRDQAEAKCRRIAALAAEVSA